MDFDVKEWLCLPVVRYNELKSGDQLVADAGFTCIGAGEVKRVREDQGLLYISCGEGEHFLDGQIGRTGGLVGLRRFQPKEK